MLAAGCPLVTLLTSVHVWLNMQVNLQADDPRQTCKLPLWLHRWAASTRQAAQPMFQSICGSYMHYGHCEVDGYMGEGSHLVVVPEP